MQPVSQGVTALDLQKIHQQNEDSLQTRATQHLGAELKTDDVKKEEDQVDLTPKEPKAKAKATKSSSTSKAPQQTSSTSSASSSKEEEPQPPADEQPPSGGEEPPDAKIEYSDAQKAFLSRLEELEKQNKTLRDMWRKIYMDWLDDQLKAREDMENFRQSTMVMWNEVATSRWIQGTRHAEAVRGLL